MTSTGSEEQKPLGDKWGKRHLDTGSVNVKGEEGV